MRTNPVWNGSGIGSWGVDSDHLSRVLIDIRVELVDSTNCRHSSEEIPFGIFNQKRKKNYIVICTKITRS